MELKRCSMHPVPNTYQERYRLPNKKPSTIDNSEALIFLNLGEEGRRGDVLQHFPLFPRATFQAHQIPPVPPFYWPFPISIQMVANNSKHSSA